MENEMFVQSIVVNHPTFDTNFTTSCVYIVKTKGETLSEPGGLNDNYNPFNLGDCMYECKFQYAHEWILLKPFIEFPISFVCSW